MLNTLIFVVCCLYLTKSDAINLFRRGEKVSSDEDSSAPHVKKGKKAKAVKTQEDRSNTWKKAPRKSKAAGKVTHMTYEEILAEAEANESGVKGGGLGVIIDATGATVRFLCFPSSIVDRKLTVIYDHIAKGSILPSRHINLLLDPLPRSRTNPRNPT